MKKQIVLAMLSLAALNVAAQDVVVKKDGSTIIAKVLEVNQDNIKYKKFSNQNGPTYTINLSEVMSVNYENGDKDVFNNLTLKDNKSSELQLAVWNQQDEEKNALFLHKINDQPYEYIGKKNNDKAKWQYCIIKMHNESKCKDSNIEIYYHIITKYYEKFSGRKVLTSKIYFSLKNISDNIVYLDLANCFFRRMNQSIPFFANSSTTITKGNQIGVNVNSGVLTDALGIGGIVGNIANGVNVGGGKSSSSSTTIYEQRIIAVAPYSSYSFSPCIFYESEPFYSVESNCKIGGVEKFDVPSNIAQTPWGLILTCSNTESFDTPKIFNIGLYRSEGIGLPGIGWNGTYINTDRYFNYSKGEPGFYVRRLR